ncbi:MAG: lycopene cyclase domain-containing protein [Candidatus Methylacidiphilales bacterium]
MTYLQFHCLFNLPLLAVLVWLNPAWTQHEALMLALVLAIVVIFTSPWDNAAAAWGIWGFPPGKYSGKIGWLPVEEYAFFVLQSVNVILAARVWLHLAPAWRTATLTDPGAKAPGVTVDLTQAAVCGSIMALWIGAGLWIWRAHAAGRIPRRWNYALHLFYWFGPVLALQWVVAPQLLGAHFVLLLLLTAIFGTYYTISDVIAVHGGTWHFDEAQITGWKLRGILPWEEIAFFFLTSLLIAQSYLLFAPAWAR